MDILLVVSTVVWLLSVAAYFGSLWNDDLSRLSKTQVTRIRLLRVVYLTGIFVSSVVGLFCIAAEDA